nr:phage major capsid protein [Tropicibacter sp. R16_0]
MHDPKLEKVASAALRKKAYEVAYAQAEAKLENYVELENALPSFEARINALEERGTNVQVSAELVRPKPSKAVVKHPRPVETVFGALTAEVKRRVKNVPLDTTLRELFPGEANGKQRAAAKSATTGASTSNINWGGTFADTGKVGWIEQLQPVSVFANIIGEPIPFGTHNAITMPRRAVTGAVSGSFVQESQTIPVKSDVLGTVTAERFKAAVISTMTAEVAQTSAPSLEGLLRQHVVQDTARMLDNVLLNPDNAPIAAVRPGSPWNGATTKASSGTDLGKILTDIAWLIESVMHAGTLRSPKIVLDPTRHLRLSMTRDAEGFVFRKMLEAGNLFGVPVVVSATVPIDKIYAIETSDFAGWLPAPEIDTSEQAVLVMVNDSGADPKMKDENAVNAAGSVNISDAATVTGGPAQVISTHQSRIIALRMIQPVSWAMLRPGSTAYLTEVNW